MNTPTLTLSRAAARAHIAPSAVRAWHEAKLISAVKVGRGKGDPWRFDEATFDREVAQMPRCSHRSADETGQLTLRCDRPVAEEGGACKWHLLALKISNEDQAARRARVEKSGRSQRTYEGDGRCEVEGCGALVRERQRWRLARRKAADPGGLLRCASCAARLRHKREVGRPVR